MSSTFPRLLISASFVGSLALHANEKEEPQPEEPITPATRLSFLDETSFSGTILSVDSEKKTLQLNSPSLKNEATLKTEKLLELQFEHPTSEREADHFALATVMPRYGKPPQDTIRGSFAGLDGDHVILNTWYAGPLKLKRSMLQGLNVYQISPRLYNGPATLEGWVSSGDDDLTQHWALKQRALISKSNHSIARKIEMGQKVKLSFKAAWKNSPYFRVNFLSKGGRDRYPSVGYMFHIQRGYVQLYRSSPDGQRSDLINENTRHLREQENALFDIYLDRHSDGKNAIYVDGKKVGAWEGTNDLKGMGDWLMFSPQNNSPIKISEISVSQWDGQLPTTQDSQQLGEKIEALKGLNGESTIYLANGDALAGKVQKIDEGTAILETDLGTIPIPVSRLSSVSLDHGQKEEPRMYGPDVRAWFTEGGFITLKLTSLSPKKLSGYSQVFGEADFDLTAFSRIEFNIWSLDRESLNGTADW